MWFDMVLPAWPAAGGPKVLLKIVDANPSTRPEEASNIKLSDMVCESRSLGRRKLPAPVRNPTLPRSSTLIVLDKPLTPSGLG